MESIHECSREERYLRALMAIEALSYLDGTSAEERLGDSYMIAHAARGTCPHPEWLDKIEEIEKCRGIYKAEEKLAEATSLYSPS